MCSRSFAAVLALGASAACSPGEVFRGVPDDVRYIAVVQGDRATPLVTFAGDARTIAVDRGTAAIVLGYGAELDALVGAVEMSRWSADRVRPSDACEPALPRPVWSVEMDTGGHFTELTGEPPSLTADWLLDQCPATGAADLSMRLDCLPFPCQTEVTQLGPCRFELATAACASSPIHVTLDPAGRACIGAPDNWTCDEVGSTIPESIATLSCTVRFLDSEPELCIVDVLRKPEEPPFEEAGALRLEIFPGAGAGTGATEVGPIHLERGYLFDFIERENAIVVAAQVPGPGVAARCAVAVDVADTQLITLDLETGAVVSTSTAPPCLIALTPGPGDEYFGVHPDMAGGVWRIVRLATIGVQNRVLSGRTVQGSMLAPGTDAISQLEYFAARDELLLLSRTDLDSRLLVVDPNTLAVRHEYQLTGEARAFARDTEHSVVIVSDSSEPSRLIRVDLDTTAVRSVPFVSGSLVVSTFRFNGLWYHPATQRSVFSTSPDLSGNYVWGADDEYLRVSYFEKDSEPGRIHPWPLDQDRVIVNALSKDSAQRLESNINFIDVREQRMLPGTWRLADGARPARKILTDVRGRIWFLISWTGEVIRITPRRSPP